MPVQVLRSDIDRSINYVHPTQDGAIEARFVQRLNDTAIVYVSSSTHCKLACRHCFLTHMHPRQETPVDLKGYVDQVKMVLASAKTEGRLHGVEILHINWMARGDALNNPFFIRQTKGIIGALARLALSYGLQPKFKISTIFPKNKLFGTDDAEIFRNLQKWIERTLEIHPEIEFYYSLYSLRTDFRKRWLPKAMDPAIVGRIFSGRSSQFRLHHALIEDENDSIIDLSDIQQWLERYQITCRLNIVRYNSFDDHTGRESSMPTINGYLQLMKLSPRIIDTHLISPVGADVAASCGMFVS